MLIREDLGLVSFIFQTLYSQWKSNKFAASAFSLQEASMLKQPHRWWSSACTAFMKLHNAKYAQIFIIIIIKMLINAISKTESNEVLNSHKTGTFDN